MADNVQLITGYNKISIVTVFSEKNITAIETCVTLPLHSGVIVSTYI